MEATLSPSQKHSAPLSRDLTPGKLTLDSRLRGVSLPVPRPPRKWFRPPLLFGVQQAFVHTEPGHRPFQDKLPEEASEGDWPPTAGAAWLCGAQTWETQFRCVDTPLRPALLSCRTRASSVPLSQRSLTTPTPSAYTQGAAGQNHVLAGLEGLGV